MMRMALGEFSQVLLASQRTIPEKLLQHGFQFQYPEIEGALRAIIH
jgi:NAD dependent epimerase/dehydratase family enzyme